MLKKFNLDHCKSMVVLFVVNEKLSKDDGAEPADASLYRSLVGSLLYLTTSRPDLIYSVSLLSRFMHSPSQLYFVAGKRVLRYLKSIAEFDLWFQRGKVVKLEGYVDNDWARSIDDSKSISSYIFFLGSGPFS
ncbi:secreted RxLR effector protein 161-like [Manihot esculenta]|uniref:secreted RxLR effector protein 161-like n=1 Tax=Manihot esculenta TaxID=3983 RepID=UPI000B5D225D|nr:secreted RxLR effector protein 161-like [Manihot esculenta]